MAATFSGFLAAGLLLGQTGGTQVIGPVTTSGGAYTGGTVQQQYIVEPANPNPTPTPAPRRGFFRFGEDRPILNRIQGWFGRKDPNETPNEGTPILEYQPGTPYLTAPAAPAPQGSPVVTPASPAAEFPRRLPSTSSKATTMPYYGQPAVATPAAFQRVQSSPAGEVSTVPGWGDKVGRDEKFTWITGRLEVERGVYVIRYATPDTVDEYNGRLVLQTQVDMRQFQRGDLITAEGQLEGRPGLHGGSVIYRATNVGLVERAAR